MPKREYKILSLLNFNKKKNYNKIIATVHIYIIHENNLFYIS